MKKLTKTEEDVMQIIWELGRCTVRDVINTMKEPKPPHSTISSVVRILEQKGFVGHKAFGRTYEYFFKITKDDYSKFSLKDLVKNYFEGSVTDMVSFLVKEENIDYKTLDGLLKKLDSKSQKPKT